MVDDPCTCEFLIDFEDGFGPHHRPGCPALLSTGNEYVDNFLIEFDLRCRGGRNTPPEMAARLKQMRPSIRSLCFDNPDEVEGTMRQLLTLIDMDAPLPPLSEEKS